MHRTAARNENPEALWAFRGGGGVGIATSVRIGLMPAEHLWAGYALWPIAQARAVVSAWAATAAAGDDLTSAIGFLHAPDSDMVPKALRGHRVVHVSAASTAGKKGFAPLRAALAAAPEPAIDTVGPCDAARLATIHLDPPVAVPALGEGRWLDASTPTHAWDILIALGVDDDEVALSEMEIRHVAPSLRSDSPELSPRFQDRS